MNYSIEHEQEMKRLHDSLSEKDRRRYAGVEAKKLGYGGVRYISSLFFCDEKTVKRGIRELEDEECLNQTGVRKAGGGRKKAIDQLVGIDQAFHEVLRGHTAGEPMNEKVKWTALSRSDIAKGLKKEALK